MNIKQNIATLTDNKRNAVNTNIFFYETIFVFMQSYMFRQHEDHHQG